MSTVTLTEAAAYEVKDMLKSNDMEGGYLKIKKRWWLYRSNIWYVS